ADWFQKGYIRKDFLTVTDDSVDTAANRYAVQVASLKPGIEGEMYLRTNKEYVTKAIGTPYVNSLAGASAMLAVSRNSQNPEKAVQLIELFNTDKELFNLFLFGIEGKHYSKTGPEQVKVFEESGYKLGSAAWAFGNQFNAWYTDVQQPGIWEETDRINREAEVSCFRGFIFDTEPIKSELAQIMAVQKEYDDDKLFARTDWEQAFEAKTQKIKLAGIDKVVAEVQRQLDEFKAAK
ncbi:MAG: DUF3502 domain-containing protein, partial [Clostridiales bacterium]|nr:DUF3502 domain-containing protein [Clostridiales bacterium]